MVRQPESATVGNTHASKVAAVVRWSELESLTRTRSSTPSNSSAPPVLPVVQVGPFTRVPVLPFGDASLVVVPVPSLKPQAATRRVALRPKVAVTDFAALIVSWHAPVPEHAPLQPEKAEPADGAAVSVTTLAAG